MPAFADLPVRLRLKIKFRRRAPAAHFHVVFRSSSSGHRAVRQIRNHQHQIALLRFQLADFFVALFDLLGDLFHFSDQRIGVQLIFFQAGNFVAGLVALRLALFVGGDEFAALLVDRAEGVEIERDVAPLRHVREDVQMVPKVAEVMHVGGLPAPFSWLRQTKRIAHSR